MPHPRWTDFLTQQGLSPDTELQTVIDAKDDSATWLMPLTEQSLISFEGPDAEKFLQGQLTCDIEQLSSQQSLPGANCSPKGMVISAFQLFQRAPGSLLMRLPQAIAESALANLKKFSVFSKVELNSADEQWVGIGLIGAHAATVLTRLEITPPAAPNQQSLSQERIVVRAAGATPRFELWCPLAQAESLWQQLAHHCHLADSRLWQAAEIEAGLVQLSHDSQDSYIPQMLNLQAVGGISFNKGCYIGQEVVARLQFRGKLKKLLFAGTVASVEGDPIAAGATLFTEAGRAVGKILTCVPQGESVLFQAVINKTAADEGDLHLHRANGLAVSLLPLPYAIDAELFERPER